MNIFELLQAIEEEARDLATLNRRMHEEGNLDDDAFRARVEHVTLAGTVIVSESDTIEEVDIS